MWCLQLRSGRRSSNPGGCSIVLLPLPPRTALHTLLCLHACTPVSKCMRSCVYMHAPLCLHACTPVSACMHDHRRLRCLPTCKVCARKKTVKWRYRVLACFQKVRVWKGLVAYSSTWLQPIEPVSTSSACARAKTSTYIKPLLAVGCCETTVNIVKD